MPSTSLAPFRTRDFSIMWSGALISNIGTWMESVAMAYYVAETTGRASWSAVVGAATFLPNAIIGPIGSALADRWDRRRILLATNAFAALVSVMLVLKVHAGGAGPAYIAVITFLTGSAWAFGSPSFQATLPMIVPREHLVSAVGLSNAQWNLGRMVGPALAALAISAGGIELALWLNVVSFATTIVGLSLISIPHREPERRRVFAALADGIRFTRTHPEMRRMVPLMIATVAIGAPFMAFVSQMATNVFGGGSTATSVLTSFQGLGAVAAAFSLGPLTARWGLNRVMVAAIMFLSAALVAYAASPAIWVSAVTLTAVGYGYGVAFTSFSGVAQFSAPDSMRGRILGVNAFVLGSLYPLGSLIQGWLADALGLRQVTAASGVLLAVAVLVLLQRSGRMRLVREAIGRPLAERTAPGP